MTSKRSGPADRDDVPRGTSEDLKGAELNVPRGTFHESEGFLVIKKQDKYEKYCAFSTGLLL